MSRNPAGEATAPPPGRGSARQGRHHHNAAQPNQAETVDWWMSTYGHNAAGGYEWVGRGYIDADVEKVAAALLTVRPGRGRGFSVAFRPPAFASRVIPIPPKDFRLPYGRPTGRVSDRTRTGLTRPTPTSCDRVRCLLDPGDSGALPAGCRARPAPAALQRPVPTPR